MRTKMIALFLLLVMAVSLVGCHSEAPSTDMTESSSLSAGETENTEVTTEQEEETQVTETVAETSEMTETQPEEAETSQTEQIADTQSKETEQKQTEKKADTTTAESQSESVAVSTEKVEETTAQENVTEQTKTEDITAEETTAPTEPNAASADCEAVAQRVLEYINSYRSSPATRLSGLTEYAEYRSRQLVSNFAHSTADERAAATALQYGEYVEPSLYGMDGEPYYTAGAREAIAKAGYVGTVDEVAEKIALLIKNSSSHWAYVGSSDYKYIAVGVTYQSGMWYCDVAMSMENTDNK